MRQVRFLDTETPIRNDIGLSLGCSLLAMAMPVHWLVVRGPLHLMAIVLFFRWVFHKGPGR